MNQVSMVSLYDHTTQLGNSPHQAPMAELDYH